MPRAGRICEDERRNIVGTEGSPTQGSTTETKIEENQGGAVASREVMENMHQEKGIFFNLTKVFCERTYMCLNEGGQKWKLQGLTKQMALQEREVRDKSRETGW